MVQPQYYQSSSSSQSGARRSSDQPEVQQLMDEDERSDYEEPDDSRKANAIDCDEGKNAGRWTDEEHSKFLEALQLFGKNWNKVHRHVGTRTSAQTRSHAQKYFNKLQKKSDKDFNEEIKMQIQKDD